MNLEVPLTSSWEPFVVTEARLARTRDINTVAGVGDRLRTAAFAELQALRAFRWAATTLLDGPLGLTEAWLGLALEEEKHMGWLLNRMGELEQPVAERPVNDALWKSLVSCKSAENFALFMATAEERGRIAGERFAKELAVHDSVTAAIFGQIALEEQRHIECARDFFPNKQTLLTKTIPLR